MPRRYTLLTVLTLLIIGFIVLNVIRTFRVHGLPFVIHTSDTHHATIEPIPGIALPISLVPGDKMDLTLQSRRTRIVIAGIGNGLTALPTAQTYNFLISRDNGTVTVPVTTVELAKPPQVRLLLWLYVLMNTTMAGLALLVLWRGRDLAALGMAIWMVSFVIAGSIYSFPLDGVARVVLLCCTGLLWLLSRIGFYLMVDAMVRPVLGVRMRAGFLGVFVVMLVAGVALFDIGGPMLYIFQSWGGGFSSFAGLLWSASYLVPGFLLVACYHRAPPAQRLRLRWMMISSVVFFLGIFLSNTTNFGFAGAVVNSSCLLLSTAGFLYAVLRHRFLDVSVLIDSTLVYGAMTALVVGVIAAVDNLLENAALGTNASLVLQVAVPLSLGIVLTRVQTFLETNVERVFFHRKFEADQALRRFARLASGYEQANELLKAAITSIMRYLCARGVAIYERRGMEYACVHRAGEVNYPDAVMQEDMAFVAARTGEDNIELAELDSALGTDGAVFPMAAHGELQGVLVVANRPGEHYAQDERRLLAHVAREMGLALYALEMRVKSKIVGELVTVPTTQLAEVQRTAFALLGMPPVPE